jgi:hypothetical protein
MTEYLEPEKVVDIVKNHNWFIRQIKKYQVITFTLGFLLFYRFIQMIFLYFADKNLFLEKYGINIWFWLPLLTLIYVLQWLLIVWLASKLPKEKLKQKFFKHPIATIIFFFMYVYEIPYRLAGNGGGNVIFKIIDAFEIIIYYAIVFFLWWLLICWISNMIIKRQKFQWGWYYKIIDKIFTILPIVYKLILAVIIAGFIFVILFIILTVVFKYSGRDLNILGS